MEKSRAEFIESLKGRTKQVALRVIKMYRELPKEQEALIIGKQVLRSATSLAANYRAACCARSKKEYYSKLSIVIEETDETLFWFELLGEAEIFSANKLESLRKEVYELLSIFLKSRQTLKKKINRIN